MSFGVHSARGKLSVRLVWPSSFGYIRQGVRRPHNAESTCRALLACSAL